MPPALVSILMPCYNAERYVAAALDSALAQTWPRIEVVAVDDGSTDGTGRILDAYADRGVKVVRQANRGQSAAANRAFRESSGSYVKFFDADDLLAPGSVESQMLRLDGSRTAVASSEWCRFHSEVPRDVDIRPEPVWRDMEPAEWLVESWMNAEPMMQCGLWLIPRELLDRAGLWNESLSLINDFEFFARVLCAATQVRFAAGARLYYRSGQPGVLSARKDRAAVVSAFESLVAGTSHLLARKNDPRTRIACANMLQNFIYTYYPAHADLRARIEQRVAELGGSTLRPRWPPRFEAVRRLVGWKLARRIQQWASGLA